MPMSSRPRHPDPPGEPAAAGRHCDVRQRHPIDTFLASLAEDRGPAAVGVLLSGGGRTARSACKAIRQAGGLTVAQGSDGTAPAQPSMPDSAIAAGMVDLVLPVQEIPARLVGFARALAQPTADDPGCGASRRRNLPACAARSARCCAPSLAMISPATRKPASCAGCSGACMCCSWRARRPIWSACGGSRRRWCGCSRTC